MSFLTQGIDSAAHEVHGADGMVKPCVVGAGVNKVRKSQLTNATQTLKIGVVNQLINKRIFDSNKPVNRVVNDFVLCAQCQ